MRTKDKRLIERDRARARLYEQDGLSLRVMERLTGNHRTYISKRLKAQGVVIRRWTDGGFRQLESAA